MHEATMLEAKPARLSRRGMVSLLRETYREWLAKDASRLSAALAFYTALSLSPLLVVVVSVAGLVFGEEAMRGQVVWQVKAYVGYQGAQAIEGLLRSVREPAQGVGAAMVGLVTLIIGASLVVAELRNSLDLIWDVPSTPDDMGMLAQMWDLIKRRLFAFMLVVGIGFVLLVSLLMNAALTLVGTHLQYKLPMPVAAMEGANFVVSLIVSALVFAAIYKVLPDRNIAWGDVSIGALFTALLFVTGKMLISLYLGKSSLASAYGAAGSFTVLLAWVYYSAQIFFFGAVFTHVYSRRSRREVMNRVS